MSGHLVGGGGGGGAAAGGQGCHVRLSRVAKTGIDVATIIGKMPRVFFSFLEVTSATQFYIISRVVRVVSGVLYMLPLFGSGSSTSVISGSVKLTVL